MYTSSVRPSYPFDIMKASGKELAAFAVWCQDYPDDADIDMDFAMLCEVIRSPHDYQTEWERFLRCR